jgi:hypothetical protein
VGDANPDGCRPAKTHLSDRPLWYHACCYIFHVAHMGIALRCIIALGGLRHSRLIGCLIQADDSSRGPRRRSRSHSHSCSHSCSPPRSPSPVTLRHCIVGAGGWSPRPTTDESLRCRPIARGKLPGSPAPAPAPCCRRDVPMRQKHRRRGLRIRTRMQTTTEHVVLVW